MTRIEKIRSRLFDSATALIITSDSNRLYASGFSSSAGFMLVSKNECKLYLDSRYFEMANYGVSNVAGLTGNYIGTGMPKTNTFSVENMLSARAMNQALTNYNTRYHFDKLTKPDGTKWVRVYSNKPGNYDLHWAMKSLNFNDVEYAQRQNVIKYCQAEVMELFANLRQQSKSDITGFYDYSGWLSTAKSMKEEVRNEWKDLVKASFIMRGSL